MRRRSVPGQDVVRRHATTVVAQIEQDAGNVWGCRQERFHALVIGVAGFGARHERDMADDRIGGEGLAGGSIQTDGCPGFDELI
ncbi:MAG TPA: hypothetical protein VNN80_34880 [Polyangiaceae bacterium]|nr:hypothetical protein [Polyangiaceae bacterium]